MSEQSQPTASHGHSGASVRLFTILALLLAGVFHADVARAQEGGADDDASQGPKPRLFLLPTQSVDEDITSIVPERIGELLRKQIKKDGRVVLMPPFAEIQRQLGGEGHSSAAIAEAEKFYTSGIGLLTAGEDKKAVEAFQRAVDLMEQNIADLQNYDVLADALKNLALAQYNAGFDLDSRKSMKQYAHLRPDAELDAEKFPGELSEVFDKEAKKVEKGGEGMLKVEASTEGAEVFIDGKKKGTTPVTVADVTYGHHYMVVRDDSGNVWSEKIRVRGRGKEQSFEAEFAGGSEAPTASAGADGADEEAGVPGFYSDLQQSLSSGTVGTDLAPYLQELSTRTGAPFIGWIIIFRQESSYVAAPFVYRDEDGLIIRGEDYTFNVELSNLLVGVSSLSGSVVETVLTMPEDRAITEVQLGEPKEEEKAVAAATKTPDATATKQTTQPEGPYEGKPLQPPPEPPPETNTLMYVGIAGGALAVGGLIFGGIMLLSDDSNPSAPSGFNTEVSW